MNVIEVKNLTKTFVIKKPQSLKGTVQNIVTNRSEGKLVAIDNVSFTVKKGEMIGVIGFNGCGKTTLLRVIAGIYKPNLGQIYVNGVIAPMLQIGTGFQEEFNAIDNILMHGMLLGFPKDKIKQKMEKIIAFAELEEFSEVKIKNFSTGMKTRLAFSTALQVNPDILLVDEVLAVGDAHFRKKSFDAFLDFKKKQKTIIYTSHNMGIMPELCDKVVLLDRGKMLEIGEPKFVIEKYNELVKQKDQDKESFVN